MNLQTFVSILGVVVIGGFYLYFYVYGIFDNFRRKDWKTGKRILWFLLIALFPPLGWLIYFFVNNRKKWGWFFVGFHVVSILFIIFCLLFTSFLVRKERESVKEKYEQGLEKEIVNWKTYQDEEYKFEVKYPENWQVKEGPPRYIWFYDEKGYSTGIYVAIKENRAQLSLTDWIRAYVEVDKYLGDISVDEVKGMKVQKSEKTLIYLPKDTDIYEIAFFENSIYQKIFNQMLSTFRFVE